MILALKADYHEALYCKGNALFDLGQLEYAIACYDSALTIKADYHEALNNKGNALSTLGRKDEAIACYDAALTIKADLHAALYNKAVCCAQLGDATRAVEALRRAIDLYPQYREMAKVGRGFGPMRQDERLRSLLEGD